MSTYRVGIPIMIVEDVPEGPAGGAHEPPKRAMVVYFKVTAASPEDAARALYERLEPTCGEH